MIGFLLKLLYTKGLNIIRWSNFPRIENISPLDNSGYVIHISLFLAYLEEKNGKDVDREYIIKKIIFDLFGSLILSDVNSGTKNYISNIDPKVFDKINKKIINYINQFEGGEFLKKDFKSVFLEKNKTFEDKIIQVAKKYAGYNECLINSKVFDFTYDSILKELELYLDKSKKELRSLDVLLKNDNYKKYLSHIRRLSHCKRWSGTSRNYEVSVMSHLLMVTFISYIIGNYENKNKQKYDIYEMMLIALYHDIPEAITGDIITPTKELVEGFRDTIDKVEKKMLNDYFFVYIKKDYKEKIDKYLLDPFTSKEGKLVKKADIISALYEAKIEKESSNFEYISSYKSLKKKVNSFNLESTDHFLKEIMMDFEEDYNNLNLK